MLGKIKIKREDYESRVEAKLKEVLGRHCSLRHKGNHIHIDDVRLDKSGSLHQIHILFREESRPECVFGFRMAAVEDTAEPLAETIVLSPMRGFWGPEDWAGLIIATHFEDQVEDPDLGLPFDCDPGIVNWTNG
ncbi:hypothetical protein BH23ACT11_BH23ACT11_06360 [soil metagenome]